MKFIKGLALLIPSIIGIAMLVIVFLKFTGTMTDIQVLEAKMDSIIGIIGVAVSVWIGLNVYNVVERKEVESMQNKIKDLEEKIIVIESKLPEIEKKAEAPAKFG